MVRRGRPVKNNSDAGELQDGNYLVIEPPPIDSRDSRKALASTMTEAQVDTLLRDVEGANRISDKPWSLHGITKEHTQSGREWELTPLVPSGTGHPVDTFCGCYAPGSTFGLILTLETKQQGADNSAGYELWSIAVLADGRTRAIMRKKSEGLTEILDPPTGRLVDAMLTLLNAHVPLRIDPRELALDLVIDASRLYSDGTSLLGLALSDPVALTWLPQEDEETAEHWISAEILDSIAAYDSLGGEIERRLAVGEDDWLPPELVDRFTRDVAALAVADNFVVRSVFHGRNDLLDWLSPNAILNEYTQQISHRKQPNANRSVSRTVSRMVQARRRRWGL